MAEELVDKTDHDGWTPLHWSCQSSSKDVVELLLSKGVSKTVITTEKHWYVFTSPRLPFSDDLKVDSVSSNGEGAQPLFTHCDCCHCVSPEYSRFLVVAIKLTGTQEILGTRYKCVAEHVYYRDFDFYSKYHR